MEANVMKAKLYKTIDVWRKKGNDCAIRYRCFEILGENKFCIQSVDYFYLPFAKKEVKQLERQFVELFIEVAPEERNDCFSTIEEAIKSYDDTF
jgi:hypothetical protein